VRNQFFQRCLAILLIFGFGLHASGAVQLFSGNIEKNQFGKISNFIKKSDQGGIFDTEDLEIEIDSEFEDSIDKATDFLANKDFYKVVLNDRFISFISIKFERKHSFKLPLFIHFQNYRL
jgi:hypothetical protein